MDDLKKEIIRKIKVRQFAQYNLGTGIQILNEETNIASLYNQISGFLAEADRNKYQNGYNDLGNKNTTLSNVKYFIKRVLRKLLKIFFGWYISPILDKQSKFNGNILYSTGILRDALSILDKQVKELSNELAYTMDSTGILRDALSILDKQVKELSNELAYTMERLNLIKDKSVRDSIRPFDYIDFENHFRGPMDAVQKLQSHYIEYFAGIHNGEVLDIGCGRGEFLDLMRQNDIPAYGIDVYHPFVELCRSKGLKVENVDALTHLLSLQDNSLAGIFMAHVVEHLDFHYLLAVIQLVYKKLMPGAYIILETPNPDCLLAMTHFYIDFDHKKPVHYLSLEYIFKKTGFSHVSQYHTPETKARIQMSQLEGIEGTEEFNRGIQYANDILFGYQDYTLIARK